MMILLIILSLLLTPGKINDHGYPVPEKTEKLLFYIQRNHNANTIIYDANFDKNGNLVKSKPVDVYWKRYEEESQRMELRTFEKWYVYGVSCSLVDKKTNTFKIRLMADKTRDFWLKQLAPFKAVVMTEISGTMGKLDHLYIYADESGVWPVVKYIELFGEDPETHTGLYEKLIVD